MNKRLSRRAIIWLIGVCVLSCLIGSTLLLSNRALRWWDWAARYELPKWAPDDNQLLYLYQSGDEPQRLVVTDKNGIVSQLDIQIPMPQKPSWRSSSEVSVFSTSWAGPGLYDRPKATLWIWNLKSEASDTVEAPLPTIGGITWAPDGSRALISFRDLQPFTSDSMRPGIYSYSPLDKRFELWRNATWPGAIKWSPDARYVAYLDLVSIDKAKQWQLNVIDMRDNTLSRSVNLNAFDTRNELAWSPSGKWILLHETHTSNSGTLTGFTFVSASDLEHRVFWQQLDNFVDFDWSPNGDEIIATTVSTPWPGTNSLRVLHVPEEYR